MRNTLTATHDAHNSLDFRASTFISEVYMPTADDANSRSREPHSDSDSRFKGPAKPGQASKPSKPSKSSKSSKSSKPNRPPQNAKPSRPPKAPAAVPSAPGTIEDEMGVPIPGVILAPEAWVATAIKRLPEQGTLDFPQIFGRAAPIAIDIGCGNGRFVLSSAVRRPDWDHVAIDILPLVIRYATRRANQRGLSNTRFAACDGSRFLSQFCSPASIDEIHIYHPQPYADSERQHRRMLTPEFMALVHRALRPHGKLFLQTDNPAYWEYFKQLVAATMQWHDQAEPWPEDPHGRSRREIMATEQGLTIYRGWAERRDDLDEEAMQSLVENLPQPTFIAARSDGNEKRSRNWRGGRRRNKR